MIDQKKFEVYEAIILSEQMDASEVPSFMADNPEFAAWYAKRRSLNTSPTI